MIQQTLRRLVIVAALAMACGEPSGPDSGSLKGLSLENQKGFAGVATLITPVVLVRDWKGVPLSGVAVTFTVTSGGGSISGPTAISNESGRASAGRWILGPNPGTNAVTATADGFGSVEFTAEAIGLPTGMFELIALNDHALPVTFWDGGDRDMIAGRFEINENGTFSDMLSSRNQETGETLQTKVSGSLLPGYLPTIAFYTSRNGQEWLWAHGDISGDTLVVKETDVEGWFKRTFVRARTGCPADGCAPPNGSASISGIVHERTADGLRPLANARTYAYAYSGLNYFAGGATADGLGRFTIRNLPYAEILLTAGADGFDQPCARVVNLLAPSDTASIELVSRLRPLPELATDPPVVKGVVYETTPQGRQPIPGAWVYLDQWSDHLSATTTTNEKGEYAICRVPTRILAPSIVVVKDGYKDGYRELFTCVGNSCTSLFGNQSVLTLDIELTR